MSPVANLPTSTRSRALARLKPSSVQVALLAVNPAGGSVPANGTSSHSTAAASTTAPIRPTQREKPGGLAPRPPAAAALTPAAGRGGGAPRREPGDARG